MDVLSEHKTRFPRRQEIQHVTRKKGDPTGARTGYWLTDNFLQMKEQELKKLERNMADQVKYVKAKMNQAKEMVLVTDMAGLKNISDDAKQKILNSYKKVNVKLFRSQKDLQLEDVDDE